MAHRTIGLALALVLALAYGTATAADKDKAIELYKEGVALGNKNKLDEALVKFQESVKVEPKLYASYLKMGLVYQMKGLLPEALAAFHLGVKHGSKSTDSHFALAEFYNDLKIYDEAADMYEKAAKLAKKSKKKPKEKELKALNGLVDVYLGQEKYKEARKVIDKMLKIDPDNEDVIYANANYYYSKKEFGTAKTEFDKLLDKNEALAHYGLGLCLLGEENRKEAKEEIKKACTKGHKKACKLHKKLQFRKL